MQGMSKLSRELLRGALASGHARRQSKRLEDLKTQIPYLLHHTANRLTLGANRVFRENFRFSQSEWHMLVIIYAADEVTAAEASRLVGIDKSLASRLVQALRRRGLIDVGRSGRDGRTRPLRLTSKGRQLLHKIQGVADARSLLLLSIFTDAEYEQLSSLLARLSEQVDIVNGTDLMRATRSMKNQMKRKTR
jgi:DNA-binding MarR family transcriptional regulator